MPATLVKNGDVLELDLSSCRGSEFQDVLAKIRDVPGRRFHIEKIEGPDGETTERKTWQVEATPQNAERIVVTIQPHADASLLDWIRQARTAQNEELTTPLPDDADLLIPWATERQPWQPVKVNDEPFNGLFDYQRAAVDVMADAGRALLADDMGLGKTIQTISAVEERRLRTYNTTGNMPEGPRLVICPNSVKGTWARELDRWLESPAYQIIDATTPKARHNQLEKAIANNAWCIVNWEQVRIKTETVKLRNGGKKKVKVMREPLFEETPWLVAVGDEIHRAKNRKSLTAQGLWRIQAPIMYGLSGTPLMNTPDELWSPLRWLWPDDYHELGARHNPGARAYWTFYEQYVDYYEGYFGKVITGVKNPDALRFELKSRLIRRTSEGRTPGRKRLYHSVKLNPKQRKLYDEAVTQLWIEVEQAAKEGDQAAIKFAQGALDGVDLVKLPNGAARTVRLRQIIETPLTLGAEDDSALLDDCVDKILDSRPKQWVVFTEFKPTVRALVARLQKAGLEAACYTGEVDPKTRTELEDQFQRGELDVLVGTIAVMKEGITLTAANMQYWVSRDWVPDNNEQGEARCDRTGQQQRVTILIPQAEDTVAVSKIEPTNRLKERIVRTVLPKAPIQEEYVD